MVENRRKNKHKRLIIIACAVFAAIAVCVSLLIIFSEKPEQPPVGITNSVYMDEIVLSNTAYPNANGVLCGFIEFHNGGKTNADISGFRLYDGNMQLRFVFPEGTTINSNGYTLVYCTASRNGGLYAGFELSADGGETLVFCDNAGNNLQSVTTVDLPSNFASVISAVGTWVQKPFATPFYPNTDEGHGAYLDSRKVADSDLRISELMPLNEGCFSDRNGDFFGWIEIINYGSESADLSGYYLSDSREAPFKFKFPAILLQPDECALVFASGKTTEASGGELHAPFALSKDGGALYLFTPDGAPADTVTYETVKANQSYMRTSRSGDFITTSLWSPGVSGDSSSLLDKYKGKLVISELCAANDAGITDCFGGFSDWIELANHGDTRISLNGCWLSVDSSNPFAFRLPSKELEPGEFYLVYASGLDQIADNGECHADFKLSKQGQTLGLYTPNGAVIDSVEFTSLADDYSLFKNAADDKMTATPYSTPGFANTSAGYEEFCRTQTAKGAIAISEVMVTNDEYLPIRDEFYDWAELKNISSQNVNLSDYYLSEKYDEPMAFKLPDVALAPGETYVIICSGDTSLSSSAYTHASFALGSDEERLFVFDSNGRISDKAYITSVPYGYSYGRIDGLGGYFYFAAPTPNAENAGGFRMVAASPETLTAQGIYKDVTSLSIALNGESDIHYTLDGSEPTIASPVYTSAITIDKTTVIRAISLPDGKIPSRISTFTFFINPTNSLPLLSLVTPSENLWDEETGIYVKGNHENYYQDWEKPASLSLFEDDGSGFTIDCGLKMFGSGSRETCEKKSFKVIFRSKYGQKYLSEELFDGGVTKFKSLVIRAGEDYLYTVFRNELFTSLADEFMPNVFVQKHKYCALYINGEYFGIFCLMERFTEEYYAENKGVDAESVTLLEGPVSTYSSLYKLMDYAEDHDMTDPEHYAYVKERVDFVSMIDWFIMEAYTGNADIDGNIRYFKSSEDDGKWRWALYDLDWGFYNRANPFKILNNGHQYSMMMEALLDNDEFRDLFLTRLAYHLKNTLADETVLARIDYYESLLDAEITAEREKWGGSYEGWKRSIARMREFLTEYDRCDEMIKSVTKVLGLSENEVAHYFGEN